MCLNLLLPLNSLCLLHGILKIVIFEQIFFLIYRLHQKKSFFDLITNSLNQTNLCITTRSKNNFFDQTKMSLLFFFPETKKMNVYAVAYYICNVTHRNIFFNLKKKLSSFEDNTVKSRLLSLLTSSERSSERH